MFGHTPDEDVPPKLQRIVDEVVEESPKPLGETVMEILASVGRVIGFAAKKLEVNHHEDSGDDDEGHSGDDYDYEDYDEIGEVPVESESVMAKLQEYTLPPFSSILPADNFSKELHRYCGYRIQAWLHSARR